MPGSSRTPPDIPAATPPSVGDTPVPPAPRALDAPRAWILALAGLIALQLTHPLTWHGRPDVFMAPAGIALALAAWLGPWGVFLAAVHAVVVSLTAHLFSVPHSSFGLPTGPTSALLDVVLPTGEALAGWWFFRRLLPATGSLRGSVGLAFADPRCASLFLILIPGLVVGIVALTAASFAGGSFWSSLGTIWLGRALGITILTPVLLILVTPWLLRHGCISDRAPITSNLADVNVRPFPGDPPGPPRTGDWIEILGLTFAAGLFETLLVLAYDRGETLSGWQIWGVPLLLVIWACFRQGPTGGIVVAGGSALLPLALVSVGQSKMPLFLLQGHLLAQSTTALLVSAAAAWIRASESGYRRIVGHIPVLLYSARATPRPPVRNGENRPRSEDHLEQHSPADALRPLFTSVEVTFVSPASWELFGCTPADLLGGYELWLNRVHQADRELMLGALAQLSRQREPLTCEYRLNLDVTRGPRTDQPGTTARSSLRLPNVPPPPSPIISHRESHGRERWVRDTLAPRFGPDGRLEGWDGVVTDITEQRALADDLRRTSSMFHALVANLPAGVFFIQGSRGRPILVNVRARQLLGRREDTAAGLEHLARVYHLHKPNGLPYPVEELPVWMALRHGLTSMRDDIVVHRPDGRRVPLVAWAAPIDLVGRGQADAAVWVIEDLTSLRQAEAALRESESRLRTVIETMAEGLVVQDATGTIRESNPAACHILGLTPDQLEGRSSLDPDWACVRDDGSPFPGEEHPAMISLKTGQQVRNVIMGVPYRPGSQDSNGLAKQLRWILVNSMPLPPSGTRSNTPRIVTTFVDITAHLQILEGLRASEERYRGLVETLPLALVQLDRRLKPVYVNPATHTVIGCDREDLVRDPEVPEAWLELFAARDRDGVLALLRSALAGQTGRREVRFSTQTGEEKVGYLLTQPRGRDDNGDVLGATLLLMDITRERQLEAELQRSQRLELVGRLASGIAHDFNNVLTAILALVHLARERLPDDHPVLGDLEAINQASEQACGLAAQMLAFGKARRSPNAPPARGELNRVARRTLGLLRSTLPMSIVIESTLVEGDLSVMVDETQLQQVLMNLCLNARDAMPQGGQLLVRTLREDNNDTGWARLSVGDTGQGMSEKVRQRVFDPFFTTKDSGTGLGLAVVLQIAESHGGRVEVTSQEGQGSTFEVWLPLLSP